MSEQPKPFAVEYFHSIPNGKANITWRQRYPMRLGRFPTDHPVGGGHSSDGQYGTSDAMTAFRALGYWASCFPEGDGICLDAPAGKDASAVATDIREAFGWRVRVVRP